MNCSICLFFRQFAMNWLLWLDRTGNTILLGDPNETISRRTARAREAGEKWAFVACKILAFFLGRDHCAYAMTPGSWGKEIWHWSNNDSEPELTADDAR